MKPLIAKYLKCTKCNSENMPKLIVNEIRRVEYNSKYIELSEMRSYSEFLFDLVNSITHCKKGIIDIEEADIYEFIEGEDKDIIKDLLYEIDILEGSVCCIDCHDEKIIKEGILYIV